MKSHDVQRAVKNRRVERAAGDPPSLGRMGRVPGTGLSKGKRKSHRSRRQRDRMRRRKVIVAWSALIAVLATGILGGALWFWLSSEVERGAVARQEQSEVLEKRVESRFPSPTQEESLNWVKRALKIQDPRQVGEFFHVGMASPEGVVDWLRAMEAEDGAITDYDWLSSMNANGLSIEGVLVMTQIGGKARDRLALLTPDDEGIWKMDFDAFARTVRPSWSELMSEDGGQGLVRVLFAKDSYFNGPFEDETCWDCYGLASPEQDTVLLGYCRKNSPQARAMDEIMANKRAFATGGNLGRATLELRRAGRAKSRQFEITRVWAEDWVMRAKAFDEKFLR